MSFEFGDVLVVEFPFTDGSNRKRRPAVVISGAAYNATRADFVMLAITSQLKGSEDGFDVLIDEWQAAGLKKASALKPVLFTLEAPYVRQRLGSLGANDVRALRSLLSRIIG